ncbi:MAG: hypothetical protein AABZ55_09410, partial [Bdellovibrionota bacterium]
MKMKSLILLIVGLSFTAMGCARSYVGTFTGTVSVSQGGGSQAIPTQATLNITTDSGSQVQGTLTSGAGNASITGTSTGGTLTNVLLTVTGQSQQTGFGAQLIQGYPYTGSLSYSGDRLTGTLNQVGGVAQQPGTQAV